MSPSKSLFGKKNNVQEIQHYPLPPSCSVSNLTEFLADGNASFLRAARSGNLEKVIEFLKGNIDINTSNANGLNALHLAAKEGHVNVVTELLKRGANVNAATKKGNTALHIASLAGQEEVVKVLIQLGANVNVQSQNGFTPLYMAAQENHDAVVSFLLASGANQSLATEDGFTPLAVALQQGHDKVVAVLLENDTKGKVRLPALHIAAKKDDCKAATLLLQSDHNPDVTSKSGFTPLHIAAHYGNENIAKILLNKGADVNYAAKHQITPLHVASKWGKLNMVVLLLEKGAHIDAATRDGLTPLHCAARSGHDMVVDLLLEKGAPFLAKTKNGLAPLHMASQGDHVDSARILLFHKAPVDDVTVDYLTALHVAAHCGHVKVAKLLLDRKADANARALNGFTPLHIACKKNRIKVVELLLKHGASIEATTESGLTPLHVASFMGCMNIVIYLIQNGANPDVPTVRGETPLHLAARANQTDIIRILLRNGASVDARAREEQTPLHIAARLGNVDIVSLLLQHGAAVDAVTKDMYTALHITAKEDQEEVAAALLDHGASLTATTKKGFTPLHLAAKYGNIKVARLLLQKGAPVDAQGKNGVTPLHVAAHYDHVNVALLLLDKGASPHAMAKNGYTPLHIAAKKNQMEIASTLLDYSANTNSESKAGFTPLHLASQEGHADMSLLLIESKANVNQKANNGLTPLHLCAQDDRVNVAQVLVKNGAEICPQTKAGYTPLHVASHFGQINMVRFLLQNDANVHTVTSHGYTPLHQAAQQGHTLVVNLLLESQASPNVTTVQGQTPLSIAQRLGYISVVETLKVVTETTVTTTTTTVTEEKYKVVAPETMQETFMTDSEDEGGEEAMLGDQSYRYLTADEMKSLGDDSLPIDVTKDEKQQDAMQAVKQFGAPMVEEDNLSPQHATPVESGFSEKFSPDNVDLAKVPVHAGRFSWDDAYFYFTPKGMLRSRFLVSFMVDARGGAMRGCRHSGVRVIIPPRKASMPMRITCRYLRKEKLIHPPPLMEGEACASRILEMGPVGARFLGPVIIEVPHFASTRGKEREITILRSDTGESWREHTLEASEEAVQDVLNESFEGEELSALEDLNTNRITRILTTDFPQYFAIVTRIRQEVHGVGPEGGMVSSTVVPQVQAIFPEGALTKKIRVGLQAQPIAPELVVKLLGNRVAVSPIVTVEPRRRKFHKPITLTIPVPQAATKGMINQYNKDAPTLRLLCSITGSTKSGGSSKAQWEDVTGSTPFTFVNDCVSFTTTVSARFWLMDCRQVNEVTRFATELYQEAVYVPFMSKFVIFAKRHDPFEAQLRVFCMTDDKEDKTLETQEHFTEVAKSRDVEVLEGKLQYLEFAGNLVPVTKSGEQLKLSFQAFHENRLPFTIRVKDPHVEAMGRIAFMKEPKAARGEPPQTPICNLNVALPEVTMTEANADVLELVKLEKSYDFMQEAGLSKPELIHRADLRLSDIARELDKDWVLLAQQLDIPEQDVEHIKAQTVCDQSEQARMMLRLWLQKSGSKATGNELEKGLRKINREDIINSCMFNVELVTDDVEKAVAKVHLDQSGFDVFKEELGSSREASMRRGASLDVSYTDEQDIMKEAESAAETSSETGSLFERDQLSQALTDDKDECAILSVHETVLSVTDSPINSNKLDSGEINGTIQTTSELKDENSSKHGTGFTYSSGINNENTDDHMQRDQLLLSQYGSKLHEFWPSGTIIQTPSDSLPSSLSLDFISGKNLLNSSDKIENNAKVSEKNDLNICNESTEKVPNFILKSDNIEQTKEFNKTSLESSGPIILEETLDFRTSVFPDIITQSAKNSNGVSFKEDEILPSGNHKYSPQISEELEYIAVLEPDVEFPEESSSNMTDNEPKDSLLKGMLIEDITSSNRLGELQNFGKDLEPTAEISYSTPTGNKRLFADADRNLFPIQEVEKDDFDACTESDTFSYETSITESLNSYNVMKQSNNLDTDLKVELEDKFHNGFKSDLPVEASDLGYFSLDKESNLSSIPLIPEKNKGANPSTVPSFDKNEINLNEDISLNVLPDWQTCANADEIINMRNPKHCNLKDLNMTYMKEFDYLNESEMFEKEVFKLSEDGPTMQKPTFEDISSDLASKNYHPLNHEGAEIVKSGDYSCLEGGIEIEKLKEISALLPEIKDSEDKKPIETEFKGIEITSKVGENVIMTTVVQEIPAKLTESETWPSGDLDTSQVSVSSLPDDEKTEPTTATVSSTAAVTVDITKRTVPDTEITEVDKSGTTTHIIQKTTHMTLITHMKSDDTIEDSSSRLVSDVSEGLKEVTSLEEKGPVQTETTPKSLDSPMSDLDVPLQEPTEHVQQMPSETLVSETDMADKEELVKTKDVYLSEKEIQGVTDTQYIEKSDSAFVPCAFVNTAFAGAEVIDEVEQASPIRARSPYEVIRGEADSKTFDFPPEEEREVSDGGERVSFVKRHVEIRRRPILQHIPSEISEEDLVEREIASPVEKEEMESFDMPMSVESKIYETEPTVKVVKTVTTTRVTRSSGDFHDGARETAEPSEDSEMEIPSEMTQEIETFDIPTRVESLVSEDESSGIKVIRTITTTRVVRSGDYDDDGQIPEAEMVKIPQSEIEALESAEIPSDIDKIVSEDEQSGIRVVKTITTTRVLRSSGDYDENADQKSQEQFITKMSSDLKDEMQSFDIPAKVETISEDTLSGIKVVKTVTTTRIIGDSGDYDDKIGETSETQELVESKISPSIKEEIKSLDTPAKIETKVLEDDSSGIKVVKTITTTRVIRSSENYDDSTDLSAEFQEILDSKMPPDEIKIKSETSEYAAKTDDITTPESDTGIPTSPFELISECELTDGDHKSSTFPLSQSYPKSEKDEKSHDSVITTHSQSVTEKTISVSIASTKDYSDSSTLNEMIDQSESKAASQNMVPTTTGAIESKPLTNGPGEVEYHAEYDYDDETDKKYSFENISYTGGSASEPPETGETKKCHYGSVSDDVIDSEIRDILDSDQQLEDIIERPVTPEPPKDDGVNIGFIGRNLKRPSGEAIEGLISDTGFAYSDDAAALSPTSPDSKSGFAYGMQFEKYDIDQAEEAMDVDSDQYSEEKEPYNYGMRFERDPDLEDEDIPCYGDLYTHEEEDEDAIENGEKVKVVQKPVKDSDFDILAGRKYFTKNIEIDELSMSSLQEFERLEAEIVSGRKSSIGSVDSLNGKQTISKSGEHDDVSMSSLTEFERIEKECTEGEKVDPSMQESITQLSEIEEGHESQASEASQENKEDGKEEDVSIIEDYNNELENIEEIILKAENEKIDELPFQFMMKQSQKIEQITDGIELTYKDDRLTDSKIVDTSKQKGIKTSVVTEVTKVSSWTTSKSLESSLADAKDDLDQDSLRDEVSLKPDSLIDDGRQDFQDSLHEERFDDADSLQEENLDEMRDSLFEERHIEDDSLHEMDIMPDESSLSLESSLPAVASLDSSKADDVVKVQVTDLKEPKDTQEIVGSTIETFHLDGKTQINITDLQRGVDVMQSSTDSLEQSSSGALAAFHVESESLMSSSLNSAITSEDYTMISSTDTLEQDGRITYRYEDIPVDDIEMLVRSGQRVIVDSEGNIQAHYDGKHFIETDEITNACLTKDITEVKLPPTSSVQVHSALTTVKYVNGDQEQQKSNVFHSTSDKGEDYTSFESSHFDPDVEVEEIETTDEFGNTKIIRKIKKVTRTKAQFSSSSSSKDVEEKLKEFLREHAAGEDAGTAKEEIEEERKVDEKGNVVVIRTVKQQVLTDPEVHSKKFTGPNAAQQSQEYVETFQSLDPTEDVSEYEKVDEQGNVIRVTQKFVVTPQVHTVSFSGPDAHKQMEEYMKQWTLQSQNVGEFEGDQQRTIFPAIQMSRSSEQSEASIPTDTSETLVQKVIGDTVVTKTVLSTSSEKLVKPESSTITSISLETEKVKPSDSIEDKTSAMPK